MEKKETRGRPATGRKQYKHIGIRLDEATFNLYEKLALENGAESLPAFIKDNLSKIFDEDDKTGNAKINYFFNKASEDTTGYSRRDFSNYRKEIEAVSENFLLITMIEKFYDNFLDEMLKDYETPVTELQTRIMERLMPLYYVWAKEHPESLTLYLKDEITSFLSSDINLLPKDNYLKEYFLDYRKKLDEKIMKES